MLESCPHDRPGDMANLNYTLEDSSVRNALNAGVTIINKDKSCPLERKLRL